MATDGYGSHTLKCLHANPSDTTPKLANENVEGEGVLKTKDDLDGNPQTEPRTWRPSVLRAGPLSGLGALLFGVLQFFAAYAILRASDGEEIGNWKHQPTVYLAALTAISNKALAFAAVQATVVTFWVHALQGTTLGQLHQDWAYGLHALRAISAGRHTNLLALGCICATFVAVDGPLLQRASSVVLRATNAKVSIAVQVCEELPSYSTGLTVYKRPDTIPNIDWTREFLPFVKEYNSEHTTRGAIRGCDSGTCTATVRAPALAVENCTTYSEYRNFTTPLTSGENEEMNSGGLLPPSRAVHIANAWSVNGSTEYLYLRTAFPDSEIVRSCAGCMLYTDCYYKSAIAEYKVSITNNTIAPLSFEAAIHPTIIARANNTAVTDETIQDFGLFYGNGAVGSLPVVRTTLAGILAITMQQFYTRGTLIPGNDGQKPYLNAEPAWIAPRLAWFGFDHMKNYAAWDNGDPGVCAPAYRDEHPGIAAEMNRMMFRAGFWFAQNFNHSYLASLTDPGLDFNYTTTGTLQSPIPVFSSDFNYFAGAATVQLLTVIVLLLNFRGYWQLGRPVTFSPLEIAKAFDASILQSIGPTYKGYEVAKLEGTRKIQYGVVVEAAPPDPVVEKLMIADEFNVVRPWRDWRFV